MRVKRRLLGDSDRSGRLFSGSGLGFSALGMIGHRTGRLAGQLFATGLTKRRSLALAPEKSKIVSMTRQGETRPKQGDRRAGKAAKVLRAEPGSYKIVGHASDGVKILAPKTKPTHFTQQEIRQTIDNVVRASKDYSPPKA